MKPGRFGELLADSASKSPTFGGAIALIALIAAVVPPAASAAVTPDPYGAHDAGGFRNVLPPGQGHDANLGDIAAFESNGTMPANSQDQLDMYSNLVYATPGLKKSEIPDYYKDATFGAKPGDVVGTES